MSAGGALDSSVTLDEVFTVLGAKRVPLAPELAGYLVLEIAEHADPVGGDVDPRSVFVGEEGTVALVKPRRDTANGDAEASVRSMLGRLLDASGSQTPALAAASKRKSGVGLSALAEELETALIPVNRAAGRRALARLAREVRRVTLGVGRNALPSSSDVALATQARRPLSTAHNVPSDAATPGAAASFSHDEEPTTARRPVSDDLLSRATPAEWPEPPTTQFETERRAPTPSQVDVDALIHQFGVSASGDQQHARALRAIVGLDATPQPPAPSLQMVQVTSSVRIDDSERRPETAPHDDVEGLLVLSAGPPAAGAEPNLRIQPEPPQSLPEGRQVVTQPSLRKAKAGVVRAPLAGAKRGSKLAPIFGALAIAGGALAMWELRPLSFARNEGRRSAIGAIAPVAAAVPLCRGTLDITDVPPHAEVLLYAGQAPVDVQKMPVGARLEFVATAEGYAAKRVVVPAGAVWDSAPDGKPRFEAAVQLDKADRAVSRSGGDPWPAAEPGSEVGGQGPPGIVRVVATPRGAEIWMLAGIGPEARVVDLSCDRDIDVLVAGPAAFRKRLHVPTSAFVGEGAPPAGTATAKAARISAK